jgi:leader peptidase (prepilin peptidase)/N-methyltransferase
VIQALLALLIGLPIGSFLNVCIHRWPRGRSVVKPRSHCVRCRKMIAWYDNIPLVSYILLRGACRHCGRRISIRYPTVELLTGLLFAGFVWALGPTLVAFKMCVLSSILVALLFSDLEKRILPDELTLGGTLIGLLFAIFVPIPQPTVSGLLWLIGINVHGRSEWLAESALGAFIPAFFLYGGGWVYYKIRQREGLGLGDVKLIAMVGSFLGLEGALMTLVLGSLSGSLIGYGYIKATRQDAATYQLPFGTFLSLAALTAAIAGLKVAG